MRRANVYGGANVYASANRTTDQHTGSSEPTDSDCDTRGLR